MNLRIFVMKQKEELLIINDKSLKQENNILCKSNKRKKPLIILKIKSKYVNNKNKKNHKVLYHKNVIKEKN